MFFGASLEEVSSFFVSSFDFVKYDIFMNSFQHIGLWFTKLGFPEFFNRLFHKVMDFVSFVWDFVFSIKQLQIFYAWSLITSILFVIWLIQKKYDPEPNAFSRHTLNWEQRGSIWCFWTYGIVLVLTTLYLPCLTSTFKVLFCFEDAMTEYELECYRGGHWPHFAWASITLLFIGIFFPYHLYLTIDKYQPRPHEYDEEGKFMHAELDRGKLLKQYRKLLLEDKCPYNFLYKGYEYGWSFYKVITIFVKMILIIPMIPFIKGQKVPIIISLVILIIYAIISVVSSPFILTTDDWIDSVARITSVGTMIVQLLFAYNVIYEPLSGYCLSVLTCINYVVMIVLTASSFEFVQNLWRRYYGTLQFTNDMKYDPQKERRERIWQRFWKNMFNTYGSLKPVAERIRVMEGLITKYGAEEYINSFQVPSNEEKQIRKMALELEGVDVYYEITLRKRSYWCQLLVNPFPFRAHLIYDDGFVLNLKPEKLGSLIEQNCRDDILRRRKLRQFLRCLSGKEIVINVAIPIEVSTSCCGRETVQFNFSRGIITVKTSTNDMFSYGFDVDVVLFDGAPYNDEGGYYREYEKYKCDPEQVGITENLEINDTILKIIEANQNWGKIETEWKMLQERIKNYKADLEELRFEEEEVLSYNFMFAVFNNDKLPRDKLESYIYNFEQNPNLKEMLSLYSEDIDALYERLEYFDSDPSKAYWYSFFDDISSLNGVIKMISNNPDLFDMNRSSALAYNKIDLKELKEILCKRGLRDRDGNGLFSDEILGKFEEALKDRENNDLYKVNRNSYDIPMSSFLADTSYSSVKLSEQHKRYLIASAILTQFS